MNETPRLNDRVTWRKGEGVIVRLLGCWIEVRRDNGQLWAIGYEDARKVTA